jgi:hypothetical protein
MEENEFVFKEDYDDTTNPLSCLLNVDHSNANT